MSDDEDRVDNDRGDSEHDRGLLPAQAAGHAGGRRTD